MPAPDEIAWFAEMARAIAIEDSAPDVRPRGLRRSAHQTAGRHADAAPFGVRSAAKRPLSELRRLQAVERRAPDALLEEAEIEATLAAHRKWVAAGRPGAVSHDEAMAELLSGQ